MKIYNNYIKSLMFPQLSFSIGPGEEKEVTEKLGNILLRNSWISKTKIESVQKTEEGDFLKEEDQLEKEKKKKGRPKIITSEKE